MKAELIRYWISSNADLTYENFRQLARFQVRKDKAVKVTKIVIVAIT